MNKALFFDFDGVVLDSALIKSQAFYDLFLPFGELVADQVVAHHIKHGGISRYVKIRHYYETFLNRSITDAELENQAQAFSDLVLDKVLNANEIDGVINFIQQHHQAYLCFVVSGTPETELLKIVEQRGYMPLFKEVKGSPVKKPEILADLIARHHIQAETSWFFGDAETDLKAARAHQIPFTLVRSSENENLEPISDQAISSFKEMKL